MRQHSFVKYVKTKLSFGPNGRKIHKIYQKLFLAPNMYFIDWIANFWLLPFFLQRAICVFSVDKS